MNVLCISHTYPYPPDDGTRVRIWHMLTNLAKRDRVILLTSGRPEGQPAPDIPQMTIEAYPAPDADRSLLGRAARLAHCTITGMPPAVKVGMSDKLLRRARLLLDTNWPDVLLFEGNAAAADLLALSACAHLRIPTVLVKHSIHAVDAEQLRDGRDRWHPRWVLEAWVTRRLERKSTSTASFVVVLTDEDRLELKQRYRTRRIEVIPNGVDSRLLCQRSDPTTKCVAFLGNFLWGANADAARWLVRGIWPRVIANVPDARLRLIGKGLSDALAAELRGPGIEPYGYARDLVSALTDVSVGVVPVRLGTGIRCKLLDFFAMGIPVVSTRLGISGVKVQTGTHCLVEDTAGGFAAAIVRLLNDRDLRQRLGRESFDLVRDMTWDAQARVFHGFLADLIASKPHRAKEGDSKHSKHGRHSTQ